LVSSPVGSSVVIDVENEVEDTVNIAIKEVVQVIVSLVDG